MEGVEGGIERGIEKGSKVRIERLKVRESE
jgi:hypothetical protein